MKKLIVPSLLSLLILQALLLPAATSSAQAAAPAGATQTAEGPLRVLFLGHESEHHNSGAYLPILMREFGREAIYFDYFTKPDCLNAEVLSHYDVVMLYANHGKISTEQSAALTAFVESGHGFVPVHCASACFGNDPNFIAMVGGRFKSHRTGVFKPTILAPKHPVFDGVQEFESWDETYVHDQINTTARELLMERREEGQAEPWAWTRTQGRGRVFYIASGHDERTWNQPAFQRILRNAVLWTAGETRRASWEKFLAGREPERRENNPNVPNYEKRPEPLTFQHPFTPKGSMERIQVPADLRIDLFASEPQIGKPIAFAWDARGRLWVAETSDYPHGVVEDGRGNDRISICEDTDGDGRADKFTVFADHLNIPTGLVFTGGGVIVSQPPRFLFLKDTDGDDKADVRQEILTGWGVRDTHAQASNLHYGFDNWLYGSVGYSGFKGTVGGVEREFGMGTYRFRPDGSALEFLHQFTNNTWGHSTNEAGDQFGGTANGAPLFFGGIPASIVPKGMRAMTAKKINSVDAAHPITPNIRQVDVFGGYTAAAGSNFIYSSKLPARFQGQAMVCEPTMKIVALMDVRPEGAGFKAFDAMNLFASSDEFASPVHAEVGPDGAVWIADWQNFIIQHNPTPSPERGGYKASTGVGGAHENPLRDHTRGRIYRISSAATPARTPEALSTSQPAKLVAALDSDTEVWRLNAQRLLVDAKLTETAPALKAMVLANDGRIGAIHAFWTLQGLSQLDPQTHKAALMAKDARLRRNAIRALGADEASRALFFGSGVVSDANPQTLLAARVKLGEFPTTPEIQNLVSLMGAGGVAKGAGKDEWLSEAARVLAKKHDAGSAYREGPNLLPNPGLETLNSDGLPEGWTRRDYNKNPATVGARWESVTDKAFVHSGTRSVRCVTDDTADTSIYADVQLKPDTLYRLSAWIKGKGIRGKLSLNDHINRYETEKVTKAGDWTEVEVVYNSGKATKASINILHVAKGEGYFDDVKFTELTVEAKPESANLTGDPGRGENLFWKHPVAACMNCHMLGGKGSTVGPPLDGIAGRKDEAYILQSLVEPNKVLAQGYEVLGVSPMPPMGLLLTPQELADIKAFLMTLNK